MYAKGKFYGKLHFMDVSCPAYNSSVKNVKLMKSITTD